MQNDGMSLGFKYNRILQIYTRLVNGEIINKSKEAERFGVHERSIQRDIDDLRNFFEELYAEGSESKKLVYIRELNGYILRSRDMSALTESETLAVGKILLESRAFRKDELFPIIEKILSCCVPRSEQSAVKAMISNEMYHYVEPLHRKKFISSLWSIGTAVQEHRYMNITYTKQNGEVVTRKIKPVGIVFSEFYFYLTAFIDRKYEADEPFPTIYRIDRIEIFEILGERFEVPYKDRFEEGEFRKRIQFMYGGKLRRIKFKFSGHSIEAVLDRLPTAKIIEQNGNAYTLTAEVYGDGIDMWLRSQGDWVEIIK